MLHTVLPSWVGHWPAILPHSSEGCSHRGTPGRLSNWTTPQGLIEKETRQYIKGCLKLALSGQKIVLVPPTKF